MVMILDVAGFPMGQAMDDVRMHKIWSPVTGLYVYEDEFVPAIIPLTFHWYNGVGPPYMVAAV